MARQAAVVGVLAEQARVDGDAVSACRCWLGALRQAQRFLRGWSTRPGTVEEKAGHCAALEALIGEARSALAGADPAHVREARSRLGVRVAVVGKGGAGKSLVSGTLARLLARRGRPVLAVDFDTNPGLACSLGIPSRQGALPDQVVMQHAGASYGWGVRDGVTPAEVVDGHTVAGPDGTRFVSLGKVNDVDKDAPKQTVVALCQLVAEFGEPGWDIVGDMEAGPTRHQPRSTLAVSRDGGATYEGANLYTEPTPVERGAAFLWAPRGAIDRNTGNLYVVWEQVSNAQQPVSILMMRSTDGGDTWSEPTAVNDVEPPRMFTYMEFFPEIPVAPNGRVDIAWYDARNDPTVEPDEEMGGNSFHDVYYSYSTDEGQTWVSNVRITDRLIDRRIGPFATGDIQGTLGLASTDEGAYIAWDDSRNGSEQAPSQDIYFTRARQAEAGSFFAAGATGGPSRDLLAGAMGAALALLAGGLLLFLAARTMGRKRAPERA